MSNRRDIPSWSLVVGVFALFWGLLIPTIGSAQPRSGTIRPPLVEIGGGLDWVGVSDLGTPDATMTRNEPGTPTRFTFFKVDGQIPTAVSLKTWVGVNVSPTWGIEGGFQYSRPTIRATISGDAEGVESGALSVGSFSQYLTEANLILHANAGRFDQQQTVPFLLAGAGYLRQRDREKVQTETGRIYQVGFGFKWVAGISRSRRARGPGMRLDLRYVVRDGGFDFQENARRSFVTAGLTALMAF